MTPNIINFEPADFSCVIPRMECSDTSVDLVCDSSSNSNSNSNSSTGARYVAQGFALQPFDVIIGKGRKSDTHSGNVALGRIVTSRLEEYAAALNKHRKSDILSNIVAEIRTNNGSFVKKDPISGLWFDVGDFSAREKIARLFRDSLHDKYKSSTSSKKKMRLVKRVNRQLTETTNLDTQVCIGSIMEQHNCTRNRPSSPAEENATDLTCGALPNVECAAWEEIFVSNCILEPIPFSEVFRVGRETNIAEIIKDLNFNLSSE